MYPNENGKLFFLFWKYIKEENLLIILLNLISLLNTEEKEDFFYFMFLFDWMENLI